MPKVEIILYGFSGFCDQTALGLATCSLIRGEKNILVDVGHMGRRTLLVPALQSHGLQLSDIDIVVLTHSHWDHAQNVDLFHQAKFFIHPKELDYTRSLRKDDLFTPANFLDMMRPYTVEEVVDGMEIEPGVHLIDTPGHTRGHISVIVDTSEGKVAVTGDALPDVISTIRMKPSLIAWDEKEAQRSIGRILENVDLLYPGHDRPFRWLGEGQAEYTGEGPTTLEFWGWFDSHGHPGYRTRVGVEPPREAIILPEAQA